MTRAGKFLNIIPGRRSSREEVQHNTAANTLSRRIGSGDRDRNLIYGESNNRRVASKERPVRRQAPQPPTHKVRRSSVDVLETSHSESESPRPEQTKLTGVPVPVVPGQAEMEADYRRDLMTDSVHMEARTRDGSREGGAPPSIYQQAATLNRDKSLSRSRLSITRGRSMEKMTREVEISQDDDEDEMVRAPLSREEERRKIIELERRNEKRPVSVSRSGSRVSKLMGVKSKSKLVG